MKGVAKAATTAVVTATMAAGCAVKQPVLVYQPPNLPASEELKIDFTEPFEHKLHIDHEKTKALSFEQRIELLNDFKRFKEEVEQKWRRRDSGYKPEAHKVLKKLNEHYDIILKQHLEAIQKRYPGPPKKQPKEKKPYPKPEQKPPKKKTSGPAVVLKARKAHQRRRV